MIRTLVRVAVVALLLSIPTLIGCGNNNKAEFPASFSPPPTSEPKVEGGPKNKADGDGVVKPGN